MLKVDSRRWIALCLLAVGVLAALGGCGGGGSSSGEASGPLTKAQFIKRAEAICQRRGKEKTDAFSAAAASGQSLQTASRAQAELFVRKAVLVPNSHVIDEFAELEPPAKDKATMAGIVKSWRAGLKKAEADPSKAVLGDPFVKGTEAAKAYGIQLCLL